ncbi:hypothetical protein JCM4914_62180 [Streptomyces platensis subsp. malvinus]
MENPPFRNLVRRAGLSKTHRPRATAVARTGVGAPPLGPGRPAPGVPGAPGTGPGRPVDGTPGEVPTVRDFP